MKNPRANAGDMDSIPGSGRFPGGGNGNPLQYSCLENLHGQRILAGLQFMESQGVRCDGATKQTHGRQRRTEEPGMLQSPGLQTQTQLSDWTTMNRAVSCMCAQQVLVE